MGPIIGTLVHWSCNTRFGVYAAVWFVHGGFRYSQATDGGGAARDALSETVELRLELKLRNVERTDGPPLGRSDPTARGFLMPRISFALLRASAAANMFSRRASYALGLKGGPFTPPQVAKTQLVCFSSLHHQWLTV